MAQRRSLDEPLPLLIVRPGQTPVRQGERCAGLWTVESGVLRCEIVTADGRELLDLLGPGDAVGEPTGAVSPCSVRAWRPSRLRPADGASAQALAHRAHRLATLAAELAWLDVPDRVERRLHDLAARMGRPAAGGLLIPLPLTQEDLGALAGTSRESANRAVGSLIAAGRLAVQGRGRYVVQASLRAVPR
jgi:CRP/FNR family transcriptional regulator, cyclic AMP receptor protein